MDRSYELTIVMERQSDSRCVTVTERERERERMKEQFSENDGAGARVWCECVQ